VEHASLPTQMLEDRFGVRSGKGYATHPTDYRIWCPQGTLALQQDMANHGSYSR